MEFELESKPRHRTLHALSPVDQRATNDYVEYLLKKGNVQWRTSAYGAPVLLVEENHKLGWVVDWQALKKSGKKKRTDSDNDEMYDQIRGSKLIWKISLKTGFQQIRMKHNDVKKTAFNTKYGQFEYLYTLMGACNVLAPFQMLMNQVFHACMDEFATLCISDLLILSKDKEIFYHHLEIVRSRLQENELLCLQRNMSSSKRTLTFFSWSLAKTGINLSPKKSKILLSSWPRPSSIIDIRSFLDNCSFYYTSSQT